MTATTRTGGKFAKWLPPAAVAFLKARVTEMGGTALTLAGVALLALLVSYHPHDPSWNTVIGSAHGGRVNNLLGVPGAHIADVLVQTLGAAAYLIAGMIVLWGWRLASHRGLRRASVRIVLLLSGVLLSAVAMASLRPGPGWPVGDYVGGSAGALLLRGLGRLFGGPEVVVPMAWIGAGLTLYSAIGFSAREWWAGIMGAGSAIGAASRRAGEAAVTAGRSGLDKARTAAQQTGDILRREPRFGDEAPIHDLDVHDPHGHAPFARDPTARDPAARDPVDADGRPAAGSWTEEGRESGGRPSPVIETSDKPIPPARRADAGKSPKHDPAPSSDYELPPLDLLQDAPPATRATALDEEALKQNAAELESVLSDFGVRGQIQKVHPGPVVTLYELEPAPGTKSSRVIGLADDIARSMSAVSVRVAVVPGRNVIGIELPNARRETVYLRQLLASDAFEGTQGKLTLVLGKDIGGAPVMADLARMPHLLIAGTTGSGKSVGINTMILSLLYRLPPDRCRFIMVDPKMLELSVYEGIPHLLAPVVTDPKKAVVALKWTVREMEDRYRAMSKLGVRNIEGYNARLREARQNGERLTRRVQTGFDPDTGKPLVEEMPLELNDLPYIVVIVDEMADLMLVAGKDIEATIQRLAQMARAAGIHLIMATQRPSVDVITGTIKANFPTRISFQVTSKIDSRTILGEQGAEQLLGQGDMLYMAGGGRITRVHGPFVRDDEVEAAVKFLKTQGEPNYVDAVLEDDDGSAPLDEEDAEGDRGGSGDELYDKAVAIVARERKASTSFVQRQLQIGYNRAARLIERMEQEGVVSTANHVGKREVLAPRRNDD